MTALLLATLACSPEPEPAGSNASPPTTPDTSPDEGVLTDPDAPWLDDPSTEAASVDLDGITVAVNDAIERFIALDATPLVETYRQAMDGADAGCPAFYADPAGYDYWLDSCTTGSGADFDGYGVDQVDLGIDLGNGLFGDIITMGGVGAVEGSDGTWMDFNGYVQLVDGSDALGFITWTQTVIIGDFETNGPLAAGTWLQEGVHPSATILKYGITGTRGATQVLGVLENLPGDYSAVVFEDSLIADPLTGFSDCDEEPSGTVSVQLPAGQWVDVVFDPQLNGDVFTTESGACDGCGAAWHRAENLGPVCFDFSPWLD